MRFNTNNHISLIPKRIPKLLNPYFLVYPIFDPSDVTLPETSVPFQGRRSLVFGSTSETWSVFLVGFCSGTRNDSLDVWVWERRNGWYLQMFGGQWMYVNVVFFADVKMWLVSKAAYFGKICMMCQVAQHNQTKWQQIPLLGTRSKLS
jgi:hypothetical protein